MTKMESNKIGKPRDGSISGFFSAPNDGTLLEPALAVGGEVCPYVVLRTHQAKYAAALQAVHKDLEHVQRALTILIKTGDADDEEKHVINQSLWFSAVITYGKCFKSGSGRSVTLNEAKDLRGLTATEEALHREIIQTRDRYIAHSGKTDAEVALCYAFLHPDPAQKGIFAIQTLSISKIRIPTAELVATLGLINKIIRNVTKSRQKARHAVLKEAKETSIEDLYERARVPNVHNSTGVELRPKDPTAV